MAQKVVEIPGIGEVVLSRRKNARNIRLSINGAGKIRVGLPYWTPYAAGIAFAKTRKDWINQQRATYDDGLLREGDLIGKAHRLHYIHTKNSNQIKSRISPSNIFISSELSFDNPEVQSKALLASERALKQEAEMLLPQRLEFLAKKNSFSYKEVKIRKLISRWGSCSQNKTISLSYYLIQLPWQLIDYVLLHELVHTKHMNHGKNFWNEFLKIQPKARILQKEIRLYKPKIKPSSNFLKI